MTFQNCYENDSYAAAYAKLDFPGTYYLAFRDLPALLARHAPARPDDGRAAADNRAHPGRPALDFGCGTGRSTRFLRKLGFNPVGVDIAPEMIARARTIDPAGDYRLVTDGDLSQFPDASFDVILAAFPFDNIPTQAHKLRLFAELRRLLSPAGRFVNLVSSPEIYWHEWASFTTRDFPENRQARCGDQVRIINLALDDRTPAVDIVWSDEAYRQVYALAGLRIVETHRPLGRPDEPYPWKSETKIPPWTIYVLAPTP